MGNRLVPRIVIRRLAGRLLRRLGVRHADTVYGVHRAAQGSLRSAAQGRPAAAIFCRADDGDETMRQLRTTPTNSTDVFAVVACMHSEANDGEV